MSEYFEKLSLKRVVKAWSKLSGWNSANLSSLSGIRKFKKHELPTKWSGHESQYPVIGIDSVDF